MASNEATYPIFETNQVLTSDQLNSMREYLDSQGRLTRANLIGIGIVCGLELTIDKNAGEIHVSKGCGVTSEGYLIIEPNPLTLKFCRELKPPNNIDYAQFKQYPLWELFSDQESETNELNEDPNFLDDKVVVLVMELKQTKLSNCSAYSCNNLGSEETAKVRRLLMNKSNLQADLGLRARLKLHDLHLPRYSIPHTMPHTSHKPVTSEQVLSAFSKALSITEEQEGDQIGLMEVTRNALGNAYTAFQSILDPGLMNFASVNSIVAVKPFIIRLLNTFTNKVDFLFDASKIPSLEQVAFLQYYFDFFDDLFNAYNEFLSKGAELYCNSCLSETLFPRHLALGLASTASSSNVNAIDTFRQPFLKTSAVSMCYEDSYDLRLLFQRLVAMINSFTHEPKLPTFHPTANPLPDGDRQIQITPSRWGDVPLSSKAIPYYYLHATYALNKVWNPLKTRRNCENHNLSYWSHEYEPAAPSYITNPLSFDLEPYNFLRIEGHLGKNFNTVIERLNWLRSQYHLPFKVIALRTGEYKKGMQVPLPEEKCHFPDLQSQYAIQRADLICFLCNEVRYFYDLPSGIEELSTVDHTPTLKILAECDPEFMAKQNTLGELFVPTVMPTTVEQDDFLKNLKALTELMSRIYEILVPDLNLVNFSESGGLNENFIELKRLAKECESQHNKKVISNALLLWEEVDDRLEDITYNRALEAFKSLQDEYNCRVHDLKRKQFLGDFLEDHPGIQHKAGVPLGGTFILVYHDSSVSPKNEFHTSNLEGTKESPTPIDIVSTLTGLPEAEVLLGALSRIQKKEKLLEDSDVQFVLEKLTGQKPVVQSGLEKTSEDIYTQAVKEMEDGTVIADFFLPYICCSDCAPIQFVLPPPKLGLKVELGCTDPKGQAEATITPQGATGNVYYQVDKGPFTELGDKLMLSAGRHTIVIRDDAGAESAPHILQVPEPLSLGQPQFIENANAMTYQVRLAISGGTPPYKASDEYGTISGNTYMSPDVKTGVETQGVTIIDSVGCVITTQKFTHTFNLPDDKVSRRCAYRLWLPSPKGPGLKQCNPVESGVTFTYDGHTYPLQVSLKDLSFTFTTGNGDVFVNSMTELVKRIDAAIANEIGEGWVQLNYTLEEKDTYYDDGLYDVLWIEYFHGKHFSLGFDFSAVTELNLQFHMKVQYTSLEKFSDEQTYEAVIFTDLNDNNKQIRVPAFAPSSRNRSGTATLKSNCDKAYEQITSVEIIPTIVNQIERQVKLTAKATCNFGEIIGWAWDIFGSKPGPAPVIYEGLPIVGDPTSRVLEVVGDPTAQVLYANLTAITNYGYIFVSGKKVDWS